MAVLISFSGFSQDDGDDRGTKQADKMKNELNLTDAQYQSIKAINERYATKIDAEKAKNAATKDAVKTLKDQRKAEVEKVLTKEQLAKWEAHKEERKEHKQEKRAERREFREELNLTPEQEAKMKEINQAFAVKKKQIMDEKLTDEARKAKIKALKEERRTQVKAVLTPEQYEKFKDERDERQEERTHRGAGHHRRGYRVKR